MKKKTLIALVLVLTVFLTGFSMKFDDEQVRKYTTGAMDALIAGDFMALRANVNDLVDSESLNTFFKQMSEGLSGISSYELEAVNKKVGVNNGTDYVAVLYVMTTENMVFEVEAVVLEGQSGLASLHINQTDRQPEPEQAPQGILNWVFTGIGILSVVFTCWMAVDCIRRKMKLKWLWLLLIVLLTLMLTFTMADGKVGFQFYAGVHVGLTNLKVYVDRGFAAAFYVPLGALIYFFQRKRLTLPEEEPAMNGPEILE